MLIRNINSNPATIFETETNYDRKEEAAENAARGGKPQTESFIAFQSAPVKQVQLHTQQKQINSWLKGSPNGENEPESMGPKTENANQSRIEEPNQVGKDDFLNSNLTMEDNNNLSNFSFDFESSKKILFYDELLGQQWKPYGVGNKNFETYDCPIKNCFLTSNLTLLPSLGDFDAILFNFYHKVQIPWQELESQPPDARK